MPREPEHPSPSDAAARRAARPVVVYEADRLPPVDRALYDNARDGMVKVGEVLAPPRAASAFDVPAGHVFRIVCAEGPQVGDLNLWNAANLSERFFSGKTRALHGTHVTTGDRLWSALPYLRPMATITADTLDWYGFDADGAGVHDVIGTRCDPYTNRLLTGGDYHRCCHSNLTRALMSRLGLSFEAAEPHVHDVLNVFMCTGFDRRDGRYFMKASPVRRGDFIEFFAEIDLLCALSTCPGGDLSIPLWGPEARDPLEVCRPLGVEVYRIDPALLAGWGPPKSPDYRGRHGMVEPQTDWSAAKAALRQRR